jgi:hypothetical protein
VLHVVTAPTPVIAHDPAFVGAIAVIGPFTVAVNEMVVPSAADETLATTATVGVAGFTVVESPEVGDVAL